MVLLGNPSSGGAVSWPLLPSALGQIGRWLPPGRLVNAQHTAVYYQGHQVVFPSWCWRPGRWSPARSSGCGATGTPAAATACPEHAATAA